MSENIVCNSPCEDSKYLIDIKEEPLDASLVADFDGIRHDISSTTVKVEICIKEEHLETVDESDFNFEMVTSNRLNPSASNLKVCDLKYYIIILAI